MKHKLFLFIATLGMLLPQVGGAQTLIHGIYYELDLADRTAEVTSNPDKYTGAINIPELVDFEGKTYNVTSIGNDAFEDCSNLTSVTIPGRVESIEHYAFKDCTSLTSVTIPIGVKSIGKGIFAGCISLTAVTIPDIIESIGDDAFENCTSLTAVTIPKAVESIGHYAFQFCKRITSITIPSRVKSIGMYAFSRCTGLTSIVVEAKTPPSVGDYCFKDVDKNIPVFLPSSTAANAYIAADGWNEFKKIGFPYKSSGIYYYIFSDGTAEVTKNPDKYTGAIEIPETVSYGDKTYNVTTIGEEAFRSCNKLTSITIPSSVTSIGQNAFSECTGLTSIAVEAETPPSVGDYCFKGVDKNIPVYVPNSTYKAADGWKDFTKFILLTTPYEIGGIYYNLLPGCTAEVTKHPDTYEGAIEIPETVSYEGITFNVTGIGKEAFYGCANMTSIVIPGSVTSIGDKAFWYCSSLTAITIPNRVESIGDNAFELCKGITSITIPSSVKSIGSMAFGECKGLTSMTVEAETPPSVGYECFFEVKSSIPVYVFSRKAADAYKAAAGWSYFSNIVPPSTYKIRGIYYTLLPNGTAEVTENPDKYTGAIEIPKTVSSGGKTYNVTSIGEKAFYECEDLTSVTIPGSVTSIGENAFGYCNFTALTIPGSVVSIGDYAFQYCNALASITIPGSVVSIGDYAFQYCDALASITIPGSVESIGDYAFQYCSGLTSITIPSSVTSIGKSAFLGCSGLTSITIPSSVTSIGKSAFLGCSGLTSITIPGSVVSIGESAFLNCSGLTSITIPSSVTSIGKRAFSGCSGLTSITVEAETPASVGSECFFGVDKTIPVYVPSTTAAKVYRAADGWKEFTNIIYQYTLEDKTKYTESKGFKADELTYTRTFSNTEWQALYVPFSMNYEEWENDFDIAKIVNVIQYDDNEDGDFDRTYLVVRKLTTGSTKANYPYLVRAKSADTYSMTLTDKTLVAANNGSVECRSTECIYTFTGTYTGVDDMATPGYYAMAEGSLKQAISSDVPLSPQRWYLKITSTDDDYNAAARAQSIRILLEGEDDTEGIETLSSTPEEDSPVAYDLQGRKLSPFKGERGEGLRGINIVNGKKIIK